jgi:gliding motility-associated-like protein
MINTATAGTAAYTFTPDPGQCASSTTLDITVTNQITPAFASIGPLCQNSIAPILPVSSTNGINGTWSPATINTATAGTAAYTFTPDPGQCASSTTLDITVTNQIAPAFASIGPLCQNSVAPALPASSTNGINGTWTPATINTATAGTATYTFTPDPGQCVSTSTLSITTATLPVTFLNLSICEGESVTIGSQIFSSAGNYTISLTSSQGCDSTVRLSLLVNPVKNSNVSRTICQGSSITIGSQTFSSAGNYTISLTSSQGCDSTVRLSLLVNPVKNSNVSRTICQGSSITIGSQTFSSAGNYTIPLTSSQGCDSIVHLSLLVNPVKHTNVSRTICQGSSVTIGSQTFSSAGKYTIPLTSSQGCDSIVHLSLLVNPVKNTNVSRTICQGSSITIGSQTFSSAGNYTVALQTSTGCDSTVNLALTVEPVISPQVTISASKLNVCPGEVITFTASPVNAGIAPSYQWYVNATAVGSNTNQLVSSALSNNDAITVVLASASSCAIPKTVTSNEIRPVVNSIAFTKPVIEYCQYSSYIVDDLHVQTAPDPDYIITWTNGSQVTTDSTSQYTIDNTTSTVIPFTIRYGNNCRANDQLVIKVNPLPRIDAVVDRPSVRYLQQVQLDVISSSMLTYNWKPANAVSNPDIKNPTVVIQSPSWFTVFARDNKNCSNSDSVFVDLIDECQEDFIYLPDAFSPNRDGINDCFKVVSPPMLSDYKMTIFNRWGEKVFETFTISDCWDGTWRGSDAISDSYMYVVAFKCYNGKVLTKKGTVTLLR